MTVLAARLTVKMLGRLLASLRSHNDLANGKSSKTENRMNVLMMVLGRIVRVCSTPDRYSSERDARKLKIAAGIAALVRCDGLMLQTTIIASWVQASSAMVACLTVRVPVLDVLTFCPLN